MLSIIAHQVFAEIMGISCSDDPLARRRGEAEKRIVLLKIDLKSARHEPGVSDDLENNLARHLQEALNNHELPGEQRLIFVAALDALRGSKG